MSESGVQFRQVTFSTERSKVSHAELSAARKGMARSLPQLSTACRSKATVIWGVVKQLRATDIEIANRGHCPVTLRGVTNMQRSSSSKYMRVCWEWRSQRKQVKGSRGKCGLLIDSKESNVTCLACIWQIYHDYGCIDCPVRVYTYLAIWTRLLVKPWPG